MTNQDRVGKSLDLPREGLAPFAEREFKSLHKALAQLGACATWPTTACMSRGHWPSGTWPGCPSRSGGDWNGMFARTLCQAERSAVQELRDWRDKSARREPFGIVYSVGNLSTGGDIGRP